MFLKAYMLVNWVVAINFREINECAFLSIEGTARQKKLTF